MGEKKQQATYPDNSLVEERVGHAISGKEDARVAEELAAHEVANGVILLVQRERPSAHGQRVLLEQHSVREGRHMQGATRSEQLPSASLGERGWGSWHGRGIERRETPERTSSRRGRG